MKDISRRDILRSATLSGLGVVGVGSGVAAAAPQDDVLDVLTGNDTGSVTGEDPCDVTVDPSDPNEPSTIQEGVNQATAGTRDDRTNVCVAAGTYEEQVTIDKDGIALVAVDGPDDTEITSDSTTVVVTGEDVLIYKFTIDGTTGGAVDVGPRIAIDSCRITAEDNTAVTSDGDDFAVVKSEFVDVNGPDQDGVAISADGVRGTVEDKTDGIFVGLNEFTDFRHAVEVTDSKAVAFVRNTFRRSWYSAIQVESTAGGPPVDVVYVANNQFEDNANAIILYEDGDDATITNVGITDNAFADYVWGVLTSTQKVPFDVDNDGDDEMVEAPGPLDGGKVDAYCNYWGRPNGPRADDNDLTLGSQVPGWVIPRPINKAAKLVVPKESDKVVEDGVNYRPWKLQPPVVEGTIPGWFPPGGFLIPGKIPTECLGGRGTDQL